MEFRIQSEVLEIKQSAPHQVIDWGVSLVQSPQMWALTRGGGIKIAIMDTGVDFEHPDLAPNFVKGVNFTTSDANDHMDRQGHGSHCAGVAAGCDNDFGVVGVAPAASLYSIKVLGDNGSGSIQAIIKGIDWAIAEGIDILSMSLGASQDPGAPLHDAIKRARAAGIILIAASGNENTHIGWPAAYDEVISVGAIDQGFNRASFSNFGDSLDVVAPGVDILSTYPGNRYARLSGTSMATPIVTGIVALVQAYARKSGFKATPDKIVELIAQGSVDMGETGHDDKFGNGLVNVYRLLAQHNANLK